MSISVIPTAALSGNAATDNTSSALPGLDAGAIDFVTLLAGQLGDFTQMLNSMSNGAALPNALDRQIGSGSKDRDAALLGANGEEAGEGSPLAALNIFEMIAQRPGNDTDVRGDRSARTDIGLGKAFVPTDDKAAAGNPAMLAARAAASDALAASSETANLAGKTETTNSPLFNPATAGERLQGTGKGEMQHHVPAPVHDPRWAQQFSERVVWLARGDVQNAQINVNPAQLGPIQINISLNGDQMTAHFAVANQEVRQAIEDAMPRLREMLSGAGINLGQSNVGSQAQQQQQAQQESSQQAGNAPRFDGEEAILSPDQATHSGTSGLPARQGRGMVDLFA